MKIAIDFDEVIASSFEAMLKFYHKKFGKLHKKEEFTDWNWESVWGVSREEGIKIDLEFHETHDPMDIKPVEHALDSLRHLVIDNELFIITNRPIKFRSKVDIWVKHHFGDLDIEIINSGDYHKGQAATKLEICKEKGISLIVEDAPYSAMPLAEGGIKVILLDYPWNRHIKHQNIIRVKNWLEALEQIEHFKSIK